VVVGRVGRVEFRLIPAAGLLIARDVGTHRDLGMEVVRERVSRGLLRGVSGVRVDPEEAAVVDMQSRLVKLEDLLEELREREGSRDENRTRTGRF